VAARIALLFALLLATPVLAFDHSHRGWSELLKKHVVLAHGGSASRLDYAAMAQERVALKSYLRGLSEVAEAEFSAWSQPQQIAFLVNAYNAHVVEKILTRYPDLRSIWDFGRFFGNPFRERFFVLLGAPRSLDDVEHGILRKRYREPRVHFAVNCASVGCPMLREEAYVGLELERQLEEQARRFLSDRTRNRYRDGRLEVSKIFDWYGEDFEPRHQYFARYAALLGMPEGLASPPGPALAYLDYDWSLNDSRSSSPR
jgi:hypothetical protein